MANRTKPEKRKTSRNPTRPSPATKSKGFGIVGIGASAGGLDALNRLFAALSAAQDFAFVVIQHLDPSHPSQISNILSRQTSMPVQIITSDDQPEPGKVYVIPSDAEVTFANGLLKLNPRAKNRRFNVIDGFLESLAKEKKRQGVGVILSGTGSDGTAGVMAIKSEGGLTFAQEPTTAKHDGMPRSAIKSGAIDLVLSPEEIAEELNQIALRIRSGGTLEAGASDLSDESEETLGRIFLLLQTAAHIDFSKYKPSTISRRIQRQMRAHKLDDLKDYLEFLQNNPAALKELAEKMFIHVTEFFRDPDSFLELKKAVFPRLVKNRVEGAPIRVWVPGCSTGEEPYSIAMSLIEFLGSKEVNIPIQIFATDISEAAVVRARSGLYSESEIEGLAPDRLKKFFDKTKEGFKIKKFVRDHCVFSRHDVANSPPFARIDLLSCRNLLIYFSPTLQKQVLPVFHYSLNPNGFLWLGKSEAPIGFSKLFTLTNKTHKIFAKVNVPTPVHFKFPTGKPLLERATAPKRGVNHYAAALDSQKEFDRIILARYAPAGVMVNNDLEIIQVRGHTAPFLELPTGQPNHSLFKMLKRELLPSVRTALQTAMKENEPVRKESLGYEVGSERRKINIEVVPVNAHGPVEERQFLILFENTVAKKSAPAKKKKKVVKRFAAKPATNDSYVQQLLDELDSTREHQQSLAEGYEATQEELTSANEELQSANEEMQSTNEELETAKEELQAANEELTTVNEELQTRNSELVTLNEKLALSEERFRLLVSGVKDYAIFLLDPEGKVATWNEGARRFKGYEASEIIGKHFSIFYPQKAKDEHFPDYELKVAKEKGRFEDEGWRIRKDGSKFWANVVITRLEDANGNLLGFSKITRDLTERKRAEERFKVLVDSVKDYAIFQLDPAGFIRSWNEGAGRVFGYSSDQILNKNFSTFYLQDDLKAGKPQHELKVASATGRYEEEGWRLRRDGSVFWANTVITKMLDEEGALIGFSKVTRDLSDRKKMEDELRKSRDELESRVEERTRDLSAALFARDEFLSLASHELKTPLTSLKLQFQLDQLNLKSDMGALPSREELSESYNMAIKQINSLTGLVEDLLDTSRIQTGNFTLSTSRIDLSGLVEDVVKRLDSQVVAVGSTVELNLSPGICGHWDRQRLEQVVVNLLSNAIKYAPKSPIQIKTEVHDGVATLVIKDFGPGIPKDLQSKIFDRFERARASKNVGGLGLGLFIVRKIVESHRGKVRVESDEGKGTKFIVELPTNPASKSGSEENNDVS